jgi:hypothetical protein
MAYFLYSMFKLDISNILIFYLSLCFVNTRPGLVRGVLGT